MYQILTISITIVSIILLFITHPVWAWLPIGLLDISIFIQLLVAKHKGIFKHIPELSSDANDLLHSYGHYFAWPLASKDFSASAATSQFAGILILIISVFKSFWLAIIFAAINWFLMGLIAVSLTPVALLSKQPDLKHAYDEIVEFLSNRNKKA